MIRTREMLREGQPARGLGGVLWLKFSKHAGNGWRQFLQPLHGITTAQ